MAFRRMLLYVACVVLMLSKMAAAASLAKPNCQHPRCGDVEIPYPFGITEDCYLNHNYSINCINSKPLWGNISVTSISIDQGELEILMFSANECYQNSSTGVPVFDNTPSLSSPTFTISNTKNKLVAVGCDTYVYLNAYRNNERFSIGCTSLCKSLKNVVNGSCSGIGCCQVDIPTGLKNFTLEANSYYSHKNVYDFNPCSFAFVAKQDKFKFSSDYLEKMPANINETSPMVLDWAIGNEKCKTARSKPDYVCGQNASCDNPPEGVDGYRCKCKEGYEGNPYLHDGCQDIDECLQVRKPACNATAKCTNTEGSFTCTCPYGYEGDGNINGTGCSRPKASGSHAKIIIIALIAHIHDKVLSSSLSWRRRLKIAADTAGALAYLHFSTSMPIIHRDVKPANILLDDNYSAKVSDFGTSRLVPLDQTQLTTLVKGTLGYLDPEYFHSSQLTEKSDVYSFGVVVAELLTGKKALSFERPESDRSLAVYFSSAVKEDRLHQILENHIVSDGNINEINEVAKLVKQCLSIRGEDRPNMKEVAMELEGLRRMDQKHQWGEVDLYTEEAECRVTPPAQYSFSINGVNNGCSSTSATMGYESMRNQDLKPLILNDGR